MVIQGILLGLSLSFLVGPLLFAIVEAGIGQGFRAGLSVAAGIWVSDLLYVLAALFGVSALEALTHLPDFRMWAGWLGGLLLLAFGAGGMWKARRPAPETQLVAGQTGWAASRTYSWWFLRGFLLNTINPGTVFFWLGITSGVVVPNGWGKSEMLLFFGGMLTTLVITDTMKAWAAKRVRRFLTPSHIRKIHLVIGALMLVFGLVLILRAMIS